VKDTIANQTTTNRNDMHHTQFEEGKHPFAVRLNNLDLNSVPKEEVINILLRSKEFDGGSPDNLIKSKLRLRNKKNKSEKYKHIQTTINNNQNRPNYLLNNSAGNAENTYDFDTALAKVVRELGKGGKDSNEKKAMKLLATKGKLKNVEKLDKANRKYIENKVDVVLKKRENKINEIQSKLDEEYYKNNTFRPITNNPVNQESIRNLQDFMLAQNNHLKKVKDSIETKTKEKESKEIPVLQPKILENSVKIFEQSKFKTNDPTHERLYKRMHKKIKEEILKKKPKIQEASERINSLYKLEFKKNEKLEKQAKSAREVTEKSGSLATSNKMILNKFIIQYNQEINNLEKTNENANLRISLIQLISLLSKLNFVSKDLVYPSQQQTEKDVIPNFVESKNKTQEKKPCSRDMERFER